MLRTGYHIQVIDVYIETPGAGLYMVTMTGQRAVAFLCAVSRYFANSVRIIYVPGHRIQIMQDHEFYADPTVFDYWQSRCSGVLCAYARKLSPYGWTLAFFAAAVVFAVTAMCMFGWALTGRMSQDGLVAWNQSMAQVITILMSLLACQALLQQALQSWPQGFPVPHRLRRLILLCGWDVPAASPPEKARRDLQHPHAREATEPVMRPGPARDEVQAFFAGVRAAGVNVAIARALFSAGVRTPQQLCATSDRRLLMIHGVGSATVRKLRRQFKRN